MIGWLGWPGGTQADDRLQLRAPIRLDAQTQPGTGSASPAIPDVAIPDVGNPNVADLNANEARESVQWLANLALAKLPRQFDGDKDWGNQKKIWAGVKVRLDGFQVRTKRRFREVEHGRWIRYEITLPQTEQALDVHVHRADPIVDKAGGQRWRIQASVGTPLQFTARIQRWNLGVRLFSVTVTGKMHVRLDSEATVGFVADYGEIPPAFVIDPHIDRAQLVMERFEVDRISRIGGDVAEAWGEVLQETLMERFIDKQNQRLTRKLNESIEKERDDLRFSMADWLSQSDPP